MALINKNIFKLILSNVIFAIFVIIIVFGVSYVFAWTQPFLSPPSGNASTPLNVSATAQMKSGNLTVNGDANGTRLCINGDCKSGWPW